MARTGRSTCNHSLESRHLFVHVCRILVNSGRARVSPYTYPTSPPFLHPCFQLPHCASCALGPANKWPLRSASHLTVHPTTMSPPAICSERKSGPPAFEHFAPINIDYELSQPPAPGQKRIKEDWENIWYFGMFGSIGLAAVLLYYKPDTRCAALFRPVIIKITNANGLSIQGWALKEAKARMEARGEKVQYDP